MEGMDGMDGGEMEGQGSFLSKYGKIVFPIAAVLAIGAGSFIVVKRKKKKEKELEEEELDVSEDEFARICEEIYGRTL